MCADFLLSDAFLPLDPRFVYIELVERIDVNDAFVRAVKEWKQRGFRFALDDFEFSPDWAPLLELADVVKIDVLNQDPSVIHDKKKSLKDYGCICLAERVETEEEFHLYKEQGFQLFQGYFLSRPKLVKGKTIRPEQVSALDIIRVTAGEADIEEVSITVGRDPKLSVQILKMVNSPLYSLERPIESIKDAIVFLGMAQLRKWALVLTLLSASKNCLEAHRVVLNRAKFCEYYAKELGDVNIDRAFITGLVSGLDLLLGIAPEEFIKTINVAEDIKSAIVNNGGKLGKILKLAVNLERLVAMYPQKLANNKQSVLDVYHESFFWTEDVLSSFKN